MIEVRPPQPGRPWAKVTPGTGAADLRAIADSEFEQLYRVHGALLFRGFDADLPAFSRFVRHHCPTAAINETPDRQIIDTANAIQGVSGGVARFELHPELSREPWQPDTACFVCLSAPRAGGQTTICDGIALAQALPDEIRRGLAGRRLIYVMAVWPELLHFWLGTTDPDQALLDNPPPSCPYRFMRLADGRIARWFSRPALHRPMFADQPAFGNFLLFARFVNGRADFPLLDDFSPLPEPWFHAIRNAGEALSVAITWQKGDVLVIDNTRFMHGRTPILDPGERRIATYFGYLRFAEPGPDEISDPPWRRADFAPPPLPAPQ